RRRRRHTRRQPRRPALLAITAAAAGGPAAHRPQLARECSRDLPASVRERSRRVQARMGGPITRWHRQVDDLPPPSGAQLRSSGTYYNERGAEMPRKGGAWVAVLFPPVGEAEMPSEFSRNGRRSVTTTPPSTRLVSVNWCASP